MSLVGPRPLPVTYLPPTRPAEARRHDVRPGVTGWAQVNGRNTVGWDDRLAMDVWYVEHRSLRLDLRILWRTVTVVLRRGGHQRHRHRDMQESCAHDDPHLSLAPRMCGPSSASSCSTPSRLRLGRARGPRPRPLRGHRGRHRHPPRSSASTLQRHRGAAPRGRRSGHRPRRPRARLHPHVRGERQRGALRRRHPRVPRRRGDTRGQLCPDLLEAELRDRGTNTLPKAAIVVDLYGQCADYAVNRKGAARGDHVALVEDAAEALGATFAGRRAGSFGRCGVVSFNGNKLITSSGGGMLVTDDARLCPSRPAPRHPGPRTARPLRAPRDRLQLPVVETLLAAFGARPARRVLRRSHRRVAAKIDSGATASRSRACPATRSCPSAPTAPSTTGSR